jgi:hypothetical protein
VGWNVFINPLGINVGKPPFQIMKWHHDIADQMGQNVLKPRRVYQLLESEDGLAGKD